MHNLYNTRNVSEKMLKIIVWILRGTRENQKEKEREIGEESGQTKDIVFHQLWIFIARSTL